MGADGAINPKSVYDIMDTIPTGDGAPVVERKMPMLKAFSKKYRDRAILVGNTSFRFDKDGYCSVEDIGNTRLDYQALLKKNHVSPVVEEELEEEFGEAREEDDRAGIDEELLAEEPAEEVEEEPEEELLDEEEEEPEEELLDEEEDLDLED